MTSHFSSLSKICVLFFTCCSVWINLANLNLDSPAASERCSLVFVHESDSIIILTQGKRKTLLLVTQYCVGATFTQILSLMTSSGLTSQLAVVMYRCTPGPRDIMVGCGYKCSRAHFWLYQTRPINDTGQAGLKLSTRVKQAFQPCVTDTKLERIEYIHFIHIVMFIIYF